MVAIVSVVLAVVTIASHRAHTAAVIHRTAANDQWAFYQAKQTREHLDNSASQLAGARGALCEGPRPLRRRGESDPSRCGGSRGRERAAGAARAAARSRGGLPRAGTRALLALLPVEAAVLSGARRSRGRHRRRGERGELVRVERNERVSE